MSEHPEDVIREYLNDLKEEVGRLREVLERIDALPPEREGYGPEGYGIDETGVQEAIDIARAALSPPPPEQPRLSTRHNYVPQGVSDVFIDDGAGDETS